MTVMLNEVKHLALEFDGPSIVRGQTLRFAQGDNGAYGVEYCDRTVSMSEAARRAVEKLAKD
ncbi:MAG: hypothetical protein WEE64_07880 [Dehalococcoidia bacterium]